MWPLCEINLTRAAAPNSCIVRDKNSSPGYLPSPACGIAGQDGEFTWHARCHRAIPACMPECVLQGRGMAVVVVIRGVSTRQARPSIAVSRCPSFRGLLWCRVFLHLPLQTLEEQARARSFRSIKQGLESRFLNWYESCFAIVVVVVTSLLRSVCAEIERGQHGRFD